MAERELLTDAAGLVVVQQVLPPVADDVQGRIDGDDFGAVFFAMRLDVFDERHADVAVWGFDDAQGNLDVLFLPLLLEQLCRIVVDVGVNGFDALVPGCDGIVESLERWLLHLADEHDGVIATGAERRGRVGLDLVLDAAVVAIHPQHEQVENRHDQEDQPGTVGELGDGDHDEHDRGEKRTEGVDHATADDLAPVGGAAAQELGPVHDHPGLPECERDEDADDVELDELGQVGAIDQQQYDGRRTQYEHAVRIDEPVTARLQRLGCIGVSREHGTQEREAVERGVRGKEQDERGRALDDVEHEVTAAGEDGGRDLRDHTRLRGRRAVLEALEVAGDLRIVHPADEGERHDADEEHDGDAAHEHERALGVLDLRSTEGLHAVGDRLDTGQCATTARERSKKQEDEGDLGEALWRFHRERCRRGERGVAQRGADQPRDDHDTDTRDEEIGRQGEGLAGLGDTAEVHGREDDHEADRDLDPPGVEHRERGDDVVDTAGDRHGHREDVVDEQCGCHDEAGLFPEVAVCDLVVAAAGRICLDELAIRSDDHDQQ